MDSRSSAHRRRILISLVAMATALFFIPGVASSGQEADAADLNDLIAVDRIDVTTRWSQVFFDVPFEEPPVVVAGPVSHVGRDPVTMRVRNVTESSFEVRLTEWPYLDGNHTVESAAYLAVPAGRHLLPSGAVVEAGTLIVDASLTGIHRTDRLFEGEPVVVATVVASAVGPAKTERVRVFNFSLHGVPMWELVAHIQAEEATAGHHYVTGDINWVAWSPGAGDAAVDGMDWETHQPEINNTFTEVSFDEPYLRQCVLADMNSINGPNTANLRYRDLGLKSVEIRVDEERSADAEVAHTREDIGILVVECLDDPPTVQPWFEFGDTLVGSPTRLWGAVRDNSGVARVSVAIRHRASGEWLQTDGSFGPAIRRFDAELGRFGPTDARWEYEVSLPEDDYSLSVRAWDVDGNEGRLEPWRHFTVAAPVASGTVLAAADGFTSIELDAANIPVIGYVHGGSIKVIHCADADCATFAGPFAAASSPYDPDDFEYWWTLDMELDATGYPVIVHAGTIVHCVDANCEQPASVVGGAPEYGASLELDAAGNPVISGDGAVLMHCTDPNCADPPIYSGDLTPPGPGESEDGGRWTSLALDADGNPVVGAWEWSDLVLGSEFDLVHCADPNCASWSRYALTEGASEYPKAVTVLLDSAGNPIISVHGSGDFDQLQVIACTDANCAGSVSINNVGEPGHGGLDSAMLLSSAGLPILAHESFMSLPSTGDVILSRCVDATCAGAPDWVTVDNDRVNPRWISLAVDGTDTAYVAYYDGFGSLRFARVAAP